MLVDDVTQVLDLGVLGCRVLLELCLSFEIVIASLTGPDPCMYVVYDNQRDKRSDKMGFVEHNFSCVKGLIIKGEFNYEYFSSSSRYGASSSLRWLYEYQRRSDGGPAPIEHTDPLQRPFGRDQSWPEPHPDYSQSR